MDEAQTRLRTARNPITIPVILIRCASPACRGCKQIEPIHPVNRMPGRPYALNQRFFSPGSPSTELPRQVEEGCSFKAGVDQVTSQSVQAPRSRRLDRWLAGSHNEWLDWRVGYSLIGELGDIAQARIVSGVAWTASTTPRISPTTRHAVADQARCQGRSVTFGHLTTSTKRIWR